MDKTGSDIIVERLQDEEVDAVFLVPGAQVDPLAMRLLEKPAPRPIIATHELSAGFMADGYARASNKPGVVLGIGACGAANMIPAAAVADIDSSPILFITGNIPSSLHGYGAFQDATANGSDDEGAFRPFVKFSETPATTAALECSLDRSFASLTTPYAAPVHLSIPFDVQIGNITGNLAPANDQHGEQQDVSSKTAGDQGEFDGADLQGVAAALALAKRPCVLVGPRFVGARASQILREFAETYTIPVATTLSNKGMLPENHPLSLGNFGFSGSRRAQETLLGSEADLILVLGADFNERDSSCWDKRLKNNGRTVVRIDPKSMASDAFQADIDCVGDAVQAVSGWLHGCEQLEPLLRTAPDRESWVVSLSQTSRTYDSPKTLATHSGVIALDHVVESLRQITPDDGIIVADAGLQRVFAGHYWQATQPGAFYSACGTAPLGWAICASIGIQIARPEQLVIAMTGDGCMCAHGMELATMVRYRLPIVVVVCNNGAYGSVYRRLRAKELTEIPVVDWVAFAQSLGAQAIRVDADTSTPLASTFEDAVGLAQRHRCPVVLDVMTPIAPENPCPGITRAALAESV